MATYDMTDGLGIGMPIKALKAYVVTNDVDLDVSGASGAQPVAADIIKVLRIPKGAVVLAAGCIPKRVVAGTALTITFDETSGKGLNLAGTAVLATGSTPMAVGVVAPATVTTGGVTGKVTDTEAEDVFMTATMTTVTSITDFGKQRFYAVIAKID